MFENALRLLDEHLVEVDVFLPSGESLGKGRLQFAPRKVLRVDLDSPKDAVGANGHERLFCRTTTDTYTLLEVEVEDGVLLPTLIVRGVMETTGFKTIRMVYHSISAWMDRYGYLSGDMAEQYLARFFTEITDEQNTRFSISCEHISNVDQLTGTITPYAVIGCDSIEGHWSAKQVIEKILDFRRIFTLLAGCSVDVEYAFGGESMGSSQPLYFLSMAAKKTRSLRSHECLIPAHYLFDQNKWNAIFTNYFSVKTKEFSSVWARVAGMFGYEDYWEYRILAYVSLLDKFVTSHAEKFNKKIPKSKFSKLLGNIKITINHFKEAMPAITPQIAADNAEVFASLTRQAGTAFRNSQFASFEEKFDFAMSILDSNVKGIINLSTDDFEHLKKLRNRIAHGDEPDIRDGHNITYEMSLCDKVTLLLLYWVYQDFGFNDLDFIRFLGNGFYPLTRQANLDKFVLHKAAGRHVYLEMDAENFNNVKKMPSLCIVLSYESNTSLYKIDEEKSAALSTWPRPVEVSSSGSLDEALTKLVDPQQVKTVAYISGAYAHHGGDYFEIPWSVCILNSPDGVARHPAVSERLHVYDDQSATWLPSEFDKRIQEMRTKRLEAESN